MKFTETGSKFSDIPGFSSSVTYSKLLAAELLTDCKKCLYLDSDTIGRYDLSGLYDTDVTDPDLAGRKESDRENIWKNTGPPQIRIDWIIIQM
jgi:lipopolysaccharide biosynthesis glycosyltransferase